MLLNNLRYRDPESEQFLRESWQRINERVGSMCKAKIFLIFAFGLKTLYPEQSKYPVKAILPRGEIFLKKNTSFLTFPAYF